MDWLLHHKALAMTLLILISLTIVYNIYDNNRIAVKTQTVYINNLPPEFEGFVILQLSDLHGKRFGVNQDKLVTLINAINYDIIAVTGDMASSSDSFLAFSEILDGLTNRDYVFYINGNSDRNLAYNQLSGKITDSGRQLIDHGCRLLTHPYQMVRGNQTLWLINDLTKNNLKVNINDIPRRYFKSDNDYSDYRIYIQEQEYLTSQINSNDIKIGLTHIPYTPIDFENPDITARVFGYSLLLSGHYHGGQFRIPFYGALLIPGKIFPRQALVSGLTNSHGIQQYVSAGLGSSNVPFRLFDTPEVNLIVLKAKYN